ncbi:MAG: hypothetical protein HOW73_22340 [Polyangiaceae bacterium]|nr:hypothetical protein [Polyangiaceae bacterium]
MMRSWSFAARLIDEVARLLRCLGKHRYLQETDHRIHWTVDHVLKDLPAFAPHAAAFKALTAKNADLDVRSRDPRLWRAATADDAIGVLTAFWSGGDDAIARREELVRLFQEHELPIAEHDAFKSNPELPPFPELILFDWVLLPIDQLDADRHAGVLAALEGSTEEAHPSEPIYQEGPAFTIVELCEGAPLGILEDDMTIWSDGPYEYADYVFRGVSKAAKLPEPPVGLRDLDE